VRAVRFGLGWARVSFGGYFWLGWVCLVGGGGKGCLWL